MIDRQVLARWHARQAQLLHATYLTAWQQGVASYRPASDKGQDPVAAGGLLMLAGRRAATYSPPEEPALTPQERAMTPALKSLDKMLAGLALLVPSQKNFAAATAAVAAGQITGSQSTALAVAFAVREYFASNEHRLAGGESVAWSGEQNGYGEAANVDGLLLQWTSEGDDHTCEDCLALEAMGPSPLQDFPTTPGEGATACDVGCRCSLEAVDSTPSPLSPDDEAAISRIGQQVAAVA